MKNGLKFKDMGYSSRWKEWKAVIDLKTCLNCRRANGKIYSINETVYPSPPLHPNCRCVIERLRTLLAGTATDDGINGADWHLKARGELPDYYITPEQATNEGWTPKKGDLFLKCPGKMIFGGIYQNKNKHLPTAPNRIWYEADINYELGYRGTERILFSNDGLIFVTYDHYTTFIEVE